MTGARTPVWSPTRLPAWSPAWSPARPPTRSLLGSLLPEDAVAVEAFDDAVPAPLFPEEEKALGHPVLKRRREFATARRCAREALGGLGFPPVPLPTGRDREPCWPSGVAGSITHCAGYRAAAVTWSKKTLTLGVDAEPHAPLPDGVLASIALESELRWIALLSERHPQVHWDRLLFSAKESVYKAWFPLARRWLDFHDAAISVDPEARTFRARLLVPGPQIDGGTLTGFAGRWHVGDGLIITAIAHRNPLARGPG
jgi:4'-phosphopantetheinyl transferase EntD